MISHMAALDIYLGQSPLDPVILWIQRALNLLSQYWWSYALIGFVAFLYVWKVRAPRGILLRMGFAFVIAFLATISVILMISPAAAKYLQQ